MEVVLNEEKKKIFRARKTMKISDRQQLETLHSTLLTSASGSPSSPQSLMNGTHKEGGQKPGEQDDLEANSPNSTPAPDSPVPMLSLNLSPSPGSSEGPGSKEERSVSPVSPFHSLNSELKKLEDNEEADPSSPTLNLDTASATEAEAAQEDNREPVTESQEVQNEETKDTADVDNVKDSEGLLPPVMQDDSCEPMDTEPVSSNSVDSVAAETKTNQQTDKRPSAPQTSSDVSNSPQPSAADAVTEKKVKTKNITKAIPPLEIKKETIKEKKESAVNAETKCGKHYNKQSRPSSTPPSDTVKEECSSGLKRTLSDGFEPSKAGLSRETKRPKIEREEFEAQLELKITAKAGSHHKLEKIVQKLVEEKVKVLEMAIFDKNLQQLRSRVDKIECTTKHQTAINAIQAKIARLSKKFGEANQVTENKKKQEAMAAAAAAAAAAVAAAASTAQTPNTTPASLASAAPAAKVVTNNLQTPRQARLGSGEVKQMTSVAVASTSISAPATTTSTNPAPVPTTTALVSQTPILQLIASTSNAVSSFTASSTTQSPTSTLVLKNGMMATGQPLLIQLPLSMANGQTGTLVNIPVSSLNAATSLNKAKTTAPTTFILKSAPTSSSVVPTTLTAATVPTLQASAAQVPSSQISLARAVYQGGAGAITTPNAGVSVATVRAPTQTVSVAGALSSTSSPVTSVPAATGSTAPGPPQGTSLTTKTDNQATGNTTSKGTAVTARPKGSVIDLTEEDDDVLVTGVKSATVSTPSAPRTQTSVSTAARSSPQANPNSASSAPLLTQQRTLLDPKSRNATSTPTRGTSVALPPLPSAPPPLRLPPEAEKTSPPQQPQLKLVPSQTGIVLSWCVAETDLTCAAVDSYHLYAFHQDNSNSNPAQQHWKKIGEVKALPLPMACTLTQFQSGSTYHFAVRAKDIHGRFGAFCEPQCTNVISSSSS